MQEKVFKYNEAMNFLEHLGFKTDETGEFLVLMDCPTDVLKGGLRILETAKYTPQVSNEIPIVDRNPKIYLLEVFCFSHSKNSFFVFFSQF